MHIVWEGDVHRIDFSTREELIDFVITAEPPYAIASAERLELLLLARDKSCQDAIAARMLECRQHSGLRDVTQSDDGVADGLLARLAGAAHSGSMSSHGRASQSMTGCLLSFVSTSPLRPAANSWLPAPQRRPTCASRPTHPPCLYDARAWAASSRRTQRRPYPQIANRT